MADLRKSGLAFAKAFKQASSEADAALAAEKAARMAQLVESERALPLRLPRATPKTKQELSAHAERVGRQMLGEHVTSGKKGDTKNLAGRSMKENQRIKELEYELSPTKDLPQSEVYESRIGDINVAFPGDYTVSDVELKSLRGQPVGSRQQGGSRYGLGKMDQDEPLFWASSEMPAQLAQDKITDVAHLFEPDRVMAEHLAMGPVATNFAQHFADANLRAIDYSKLRKKDMEMFDRIIAGGYDKKNPKTGVVETVAFPNWPGIADPEAAYAAMKADPELRKWFNSRMKTPAVTKATNMPNGLDVQWAITAPELRNMEVNLTGHSVGEMVPSAKLTDTAEHETYSKGIRGKYKGHQGVLTPFQISYPDAAQHIASTQRPQDFTGTIQKVFPHQIVDQQYLDEYGEYKRQLEKILTGKKKGGSVNRDDYQARLDAMMEKHMAGGGGAFKKIQLKAQGGAAFKTLQFKAEGGTIDNTVPDRSDGGQINFAPKYASGGAIHHGIKPLQWKAKGGRIQKFDGGGIAIDQSELGSDEPSKAKLTAEILARMAKEQGKTEIESLKKPRALTDILNRGVVASAVGAPVDIINMGLEGIDFLREKATGKPVENRLASDKPVGGSEQIKDLMNRYNMTSGEERPMMETALSFVSPAGAVKGVSSAGKVGAKAEGALNKISNLELNKSGKLSNPATTASEATVGTTQGAKYATKQEGPFFRVRQTAADQSKGADRGTREASGLSSQRVGAGGAGEAGSRLPQRYSTEEVDRIVKDPTLNEPLQIAQRYTKENLGTDFVAPDIPESSLAKQSAIARTHELALTDDPAYKSAVFDAYAKEMPEVLEQAGAKNYDDLMEKAYRQLAKETDAQFQALPFNFSYHRGGEGNYSGTREMLEDIHGNKHMYVYQGGDPHDFLNKVDDVTGLNENEKFRAVHDAMGHAIYGNEFGPLGEEKAWAIHQQMYSPLARLAMTAETRGQNSMVNYSPLNVNLKEEVAKLRELQIESRRRGDKEGERIATEAIRDAFSGFQFAPQKAILLPPEFVNPKYTGGMPDYIQPLITPSAGTTTKSALTHFSHRPDLTSTDPSKYGTGIKGAEKARLENTNNPLIPRTYFYAGEPGAVAPESGLGVNRYRSESESLYDITKDPLRLKTLAREANRTPYTAKYNAGLRAPDQELTDVERMIREYGYEGYINPATTKPAAVLYTPKQVERRRKGGLAMVKA